VGYRNKQYTMRSGGNCIASPLRQKGPHFICLANEVMKTAAALQPWVLFFVFITAALLLSAAEAKVVMAAVIPHGDFALDPSLV